MLDPKKQVILAAFAHPDDESYIVGGTLAMCAQAGARVVLYTATSGEKGKSGIYALSDDSELAQLRADEIMCASKALGIQRLVLKQYPDGGANAFIDNITEDLVNLCEEENPTILITFGTDSTDGYSGHPDHITLGQATRHVIHSDGCTKKLCKAYHVARATSHFRDYGLNKPGLNNDQVTLTLNVEKWIEKKLTALACHKTQYTTMSAWNLEPSKRRAILSKEFLVRTYPNWFTGSAAENSMWETN